MSGVSRTPRSQAVKKGPSSLRWSLGMRVGVTAKENSGGGSFKKKKKAQIELPDDLHDPTPGHIPGEKHGPKGYTRPRVCSAVYSSQDVEAT